MRAMLRRGWQLFGGYSLRPSAWARPEPKSAAALVAALSGRVLIVAAHPDDDIIGAGILLSRLEGAQVLFVTDGAARRGVRKLRNITVKEASPDMKSVYGATRVLMLPSQVQEGGPRVILEAQINGIPVIASDLAAPRN